MRRIAGKLGLNPPTRGNRTAGHLGRLPAVFPVGLYTLPHYVAGSLPPPPPEVPTPTVNWQVLGNDQYGNCVTEQTLVQSSRPSRGFRTFYRGPVVEVTCESGKRLSITPNHAVLTPRGFIRARFLQEGDYTVSGQFSQGGNGSFDYDFNESPALIQDVFTSLSGSRSMCLAEHFHDDARFMDRYIDVVAPKRHLWSEFNASLSEPQRQQQVVSSSRDHGSFSRQSGSLQSEQAGWTPSFGSVGLGHNRPSLFGGHSGIHDAQILASGARLNSFSNQQVHEALVPDSELLSQMNGGFSFSISSNGFGHLNDSSSILPFPPHPVGFGVRPAGYASDFQPPSDGGTTDTQLASDLCLRFPSQISLDRIIKICWNPYHGPVYDLSTEPNWYAANGILVHNCGVAGIEHVFMADAFVTKTRESFPSSTDCVEYYLNYTDGKDSGVVLSQFLSYVRTHGYYRHSVKAYAPIANHDTTTLRQTISLYDAAYTGIVVTDSMQKAFEANQPWTSSTIPGHIVGGHCVPAVAYDEHFLYVVTWGQIQAVSWLGWLSIVQEAWAIITGELFDHHGNGRGVNIDVLETDLNNLNVELRGA